MLRHARTALILLHLTVGCALGAAAPATLLPDPIYPDLGQPGLDVQHYDIHLTVPQPGTPWLRAQVRIDLQAKLPLNDIRLDYQGPTVLSVQWNGMPVPYHLQASPAKLIIPRALPTGAAATLTIVTAGDTRGLPDPTLPIQLGWQSVPASPEQPGANFAFSEPDGTHTFLPCNDHPSDPATFTTHLTVPQDVQAVASGRRTGETQHPDGTHTLTYTLDTPIPTYALGIHIGTLQEVRRPAALLPTQSVDLSDYFPTSVPLDVRAPYQRTTDILKVLTDWFGPYPFATYGSVVVTPPLPALETASLSTMPVRSSRERVIVHELAHQWFGNAVPLARWSDTWLNEGFATYAELLWAEANAQDTTPLLASWRDRLRGGTRPLTATTQAELFDSTAYARGALTLHALRQQVGDPAFRTFLQTYARTRAAQPTQTADLLSLSRQYLGADAETLLRRWIDRPTLPAIP
ncbi:M1 family metallopeptidase [Deinococcus sedimenti]|uniref:Aminopeptidase N n=1 Tax=Deinococcus sedimenti TaxID=1867090 RepID=A0ABQ2S9J6_9DEIO|nr:M1 family metallopeptidase [Deinococcus sedimenti]GGS11776.1 zinc metalloprotease [Deinococcus sedimenti]